VGAVEEGCRWRVGKEEDLGPEAAKGPPTVHQESVPGSQRGVKANHEAMTPR